MYSDADICCDSFCDVGVGAVLVMVQAMLVVVVRFLGRGGAMVGEECRLAVNCMALNRSSSVTQPLTLTLPDPDPHPDSGPEPHPLPHAHSDPKPPSRSL